MKKATFLIAAFLALPNDAHAFFGFGKYASKAEAQQACWDWSNKGVKYEWWSNGIGIYRKGWHKAKNRVYRFEKETQQFLGYENKDIKPIRYNDIQLSGRVVKRFKF